MKIKYKLLFLIFLILGLLCKNLLSRNPFFFESDKVNQKNIGNHENINLVAILSCNSSFGAVLQRTDIQETVYIGDTVWGYKVIKICENQIELFKNNKKINLNI